MNAPPVMGNLKLQQTEDKEHGYTMYIILTGDLLFVKMYQN